LAKFIAGLEKSIKTTFEDKTLRGRIDSLFGNVVIEFERDLDKKPEEAIEQIKLYIVNISRRKIFGLKRCARCTDIEQVNLFTEKRNLRAVIIIMPVSESIALI
jgi:hypothetical protein